jgi:hypothetical protein
MVINSNKCNECSIEIPIGRKFCGSSCAAKFNNKVYPKRTHGRTKPICLNCGNIIEYGRYNRKYCNNKCQNDKIQKDILNKVQNEEFDKLGNKSSIDRTSKKYLIKTYGEKCMKCGWDEINKWTKKVPIELNHIDGNPENHSLENLELICPNCHSLTEFNKSRGKGRKWRKTIFIK